MRLQLKLGLANGLDKLGVIAALRRLRLGSRGAILTFHRVLPEEDKADCYEPHLIISEGIFEELLLLLCREFNVVSLEQILNRPPERNHRQPVALTFDDGWVDTYSVAYPMLLRYQLPATVFLCTGLMGANYMLPEERFFQIWRHCAAHERLPLLLKDMRNWGLPNSSAADRCVWARQIKKLSQDAKRIMLTHLEYAYDVPKDGLRRFLTWDEARLMAQNGIMFGSHTVDHCTLPMENDATILRELENSYRAIGENLGAEARFVAYPNGAYDSRVMRIAERAGYTHGFTTDRGLLGHRTPAHAVPRINMDDSVLVGRSSRLDAARARLHLQPLVRSSSFTEAHSFA